MTRNCEFFKVAQFLDYSSFLNVHVSKFQRGRVADTSVADTRIPPDLLTVKEGDLKKMTLFAMFCYLRKQVMLKCYQFKPGV